jgi:glycosyltransferase involved in cell wall biosynthesis
VTSQSALEYQGVASSIARPHRPSARGVAFWYEAVDIAKALASQRYRIGNFVELVRGASAVAGKRFPSHLLGQVRTVSCLRPLVDPELGRTLTALRRAGVHLVADYDDLIFAGEVAGLPRSVGGSLGARTKAQRLEAYASGLRLFDRVTVSTRALARHLEAFSTTPVTVVPNALSESWVRHGQALYPAFLPGDPLVIRYLCGSPSHDADWASIVAPLAQFLRDHPQVCLEVVGPVRFDPEPFPPSQLRQVRSVSYEELPRLLASSWVTLAPLLQNPFNDCRSAIKFLEAGAFGCPTLLSANDDLRRHEELGAPIAFCHTARDWYEQLSSLLDLERRQQLGAAAKNHVASHGMAQHQLGTWLSVLGEKGHG